ncbi:MAG: imidazolonepropionase [Candidatus Riflebacteria bacterium]|nr:imidazolonepropionase [Candidatus Riflebacteria bacterium]
MKPVADVVLHNLAAATLFPRPYRGKGTPVGWEVEERPAWSIAGKDGAIVWMGPAARLGAEVDLAADCVFVNGAGLVAVPGFVDSHTHLVYAGDRSDEFEMRVQGRPYLDILAAGGGILRSVEAVRQGSEEELYQEAAQRLVEALAWGTTTIEIKTGYGLDLPTELKMLRVIDRLRREMPVRIVATFMGAHAVPAARKADPDGFTDEICRDWIPEVAKTGLAAFNDVFTENKAFSVAQSRKILEAGVAHGLRPKIHADEINVLGGVDLAVEVGAVSADHLLMTGPEGIAKLAGSGVIPTVLPGTSTYLMEKHHAPARAMIEAGLPLAIASDHNPGSCQFLGAGLIQSLAMLQLRLSAGEALVAGTLHAAHALGQGDRLGALEVGRQFDAVLLDATSYRQVGYRVGQNLVRNVLIGGRPVFQGA